MRIKRVKAVNFLSYETLDYRPTTGLTLVYGVNHDKNPPDSNGAGKSGLLHAVNYAIQGKLPYKEYRVSSVVRISTEEAAVDLWLEDDTAGIHIHRSSKEFWWKESDGRLYDGDKNETQDKLNKRLGIHYKLYYNLVFLSPASKVSSLREMGDTARLRLLEDLVHAGYAPFEQAGEKAGMEKALVKDQISKLTTEIEGIRKFADTTANSLVRLRQKLYDEESRLRAVENEVRNRAQNWETQILSLRQRINAEEPRDLNEGELTSQLSEVNQWLSAAQAEAQVASRMLQSQIQVKAGDYCPTCRQQVPQTHVHDMQQKAKEAQHRYQQTAALLPQYQKEARAIQEKLNTLRTWPHRKAALEAEIASLQTQFYAVRENLQDNVLAVIRDEIAQAEAHLKHYNQEEARLNRRLSNAIQYLPVVETLEKGFKQGIKSMLLDDVRAQLAFYTDQYMGLLCGEDIRVTYPVEATDTFPMVISRGEVAESLPSGGEYTRVDLALLLAVREVFYARNACRLDFLFLDDWFGKLDNEGCHNASQLLQRLEGRVAQVLVTVPREMDLESNAEILVTKRNGISTLGGHR